MRGAGEVAIALAEGQSLTYQQLTDHCRASRAGFKRPKDVLLLPSLPRNPSGKGEGASQGD